MGRNTAIGVKECIRHIDNIKEVYIANDVDKNIVEKLIKECNEKTIEIKYVSSMKELGKMFNIKVKVAAAANLKEGGE